jgi:hypothetical protein
MESADYQVYAADLEEYELDDLQVVLDEIGKSARRQFEAGFPEVGRIIDACDCLIYERRKEERIQREKSEWENHVARVKAEAPMTDAEKKEWEDRWRDLNQKLGMRRPPWEGSVDWHKRAGNL